MTPRLKFCGLRRAADVEAVNAYPPDYAGFVFAESRRRVTAQQARALAAGLLPGIRRVGVFVNETAQRAAEIALYAGLDVIQLHGDEDAEYLRALRACWPGQVWKAARVRTAADIRAVCALAVDAVLLDAFSPTAYGGTGSTADWDLIARSRPETRFFLAGGLHAGNLLEAVKAVRPDGVDLSGGIETDGVKDAARMREIYELLGGPNER